MVVTPRIDIQEADFDLGRAWAQLQSALGSDVGAIAGFSGLVRGASRSTAGGGRADDEVEALYLEHYPGMTEASIESIVQRAAQRWPLLGVHVVHRVGRLVPGAQIVMVLVASSHRAAAFAACEFVMDYLKTDVVLWKREDYRDGSHWLHPADTDRTRRAGWAADLDEESAD